MSSPPALDLAFHPTDLAPVAVLGTATVLYLIYHYAGCAGRWEQRLRGVCDAAQLPAAAIFAQRITGAILFGAIPIGVAAALGYSPMRLGLGAGRPGIGFACFALVAGAVVPIVARASRGPALRARYPELRMNEWSRGLIALNALTWVLYLLGYETLFRGFLLVPLVEALGTWPAIAANTALYVAVHLTKDASEAVGTVVMGVVFALMALTSGSVWAPFAVHVAVALTSDTVARRANAGMRTV